MKLLYLTVIAVGMLASGDAQRQRPGSFGGSGQVNGQSIGRPQTNPESSRVPKVPGGSRDPEQERPTGGDAPAHNAEQKPEPKPEGLMETVKAIFSYSLADFARK